MRVRPLGDRILVKQAPKEEVTSFGIVLPETVNQEQKAEGVIIALGTGEKLAKLALSEGDIVLFSKYGGDEIDIDGQAHKILSHDAILAVLEK
jgi:chaperonin GroES